MEKITKFFTKSSKDKESTNNNNNEISNGDSNTLASSILDSISSAISALSISFSKTKNQKNSQVIEIEGKLKQ